MSIFKLEKCFVLFQTGQTHFALGTYDAKHDFDNSNSEKKYSLCPFGKVSHCSLPQLDVVGFSTCDNTSLQNSPPENHHIIRKTKKGNVVRPLIGLLFIEFRSCHVCGVRFSFLRTALTPFRMPDLYTSGMPVVFWAER